TVSPAFLCQLAMVASDTDSGSTGTLTSMLMDVVLLEKFGGVVRLFGQLFGDMVAIGRIDQRVGKQGGLFGDVRLQMTAGRGRGTGAAGVVENLFGLQAGAQVMLDLVPG